MTTFTLILTALVAAAVLYFGRQLFWLFMAGLGFLAGFNLAAQLLVPQPDWMLLLIGVLSGIIGALLAILLQYTTVGIAGFLSGAYLTLLIWQSLTIPGPDWIMWLTAALFGAVTLILFLVFFDWALIVSSAFIGALSLVQMTGWDPLWQLLTFALLVISGILFQGQALDRAPEYRPIAQT